MTDDQIAAVIQDRFERWGKFLREHHSTPLLVLGIDAQGNEPSVMTCEGQDDEFLIKLLDVAKVMLRHGSSEQLDAKTVRRHRNWRPVL